MKYGIFSPYPVKRGNFHKGTEPTIEWRFNPYWGTHDTRNEAKVRWSREMFTEFADCDNTEMMVRAFDSQRKSSLCIARVGKAPENAESNLTTKDA